MEDSLGNLSKQVEHIFLYKEFEKICPYYISIGMSYEQFWYGETSMTKAYLEAYKLKEKKETIKNKWSIWELGLYIYEALCYVSPIIRAFSKAKKPLPYPSKPHEIDKIQSQLFNDGDDSELKKKEKEKEDKLKELENFKSQIFFKNWAKSVKKNFKEGGQK